MRRIFKIFILLFSLTLIQCSSDENSSSDLLYNGTTFKTGNGSAYNTIKSESEGGIWLNIREKDANDPKNILIVLYHEAGNHSGTYTLENNMAGPGIASVTIMDDDGNQLIGGSIDGPTGTIDVTDFGGNRFKITFNDVVLDAGTANETTISGSVNKVFTTAIEG